MESSIDCMGAQAETAMENTERTLAQFLLCHERRLLRITERHCPPSHVIRYGHNPNWNAEDVYAIARTKILRAARTGKLFNGRNDAAYVTKILRNTINDEYRRSKTREGIWNERETSTAGIEHQENEDEFMEIDC